ELSPEHARELIVAAAPFSRSTMEDLILQGQQADPRKLESTPLTMLVLFPLPAGVTPKDADLPPRGPDGAIWFPVPDRSDLVTLFPPQSISGIRIFEAGERSSRVRGMFSVWGGKTTAPDVEFVAERVEGQWRIAEFFVPVMRLGTRLEDGRWKRFERE
ncbi:MAG: hypothetical protein ABFS86_20445, partial [Planctomycetota bacterium]